MRISDLSNKEIINYSEGRMMGKFDDLELDIDNGIIKSLIITGRSGFLGLFSDEADSFIDWDKIMKIGQDVIIVDLSLNLEKNFKNEAK